MAKNLVQLWDAANQASADRRMRRGQIGKINASGPPTVEVPGSGGRLVYVRMGPGGADGDIMAVPRGVPKRAHVYVLCHKEDKQWVAELDTSAVNQNGSGSAGVAPHTHRRNSGNEFVVESELFQPGIVLPAGGLTVSIGSFRYPNSTNGKTYPGGTLDLTSHIPSTANKWRWLIVGIDPDTNAAVAVSGSDFDTQAELTLAEIDNVTFTGDIPLAAIQVANGDTALTDHSRYYDARPWFVPADDGAIPSHDHEDAAGGGQLDHGLALTGLTDDDHTQYVLADGTRAFTGDQSLGDNTLTSVGGINFGDETLDTYDEGEWSPSILGSVSNPTVSFSVEAASYQLDGNVCSFFFRLTINTISGGSGTARITLPFTASNLPTGIQYQSTARTDGVDLPGTPVMLTFQPVGGQAYGSFNAIQDDAGAQAVQISGISNGDILMASGQYVV